MSTAPSRRAARPPSVPIPIPEHAWVRHLPAVGAAKAVHVVFLGNFVHQVTHSEHGRNRPCTGEGCLLCAHPKEKVSATSLAWYAPVLMHYHGEVLPDDSPRWRRLVLASPTRSAAVFGVEYQGEKTGYAQPNMRGRHCFAWRINGHPNGGYQADAWGRCYELVESAFDVMPFVDNAFHNTEETQLATIPVRRTFPPAVIPPVLTPPPAAVPISTPEDAELVRQLLAQFRANGHRLPDPNAPPAGVTPEEWKQATTRTGTQICDHVKQQQAAKRKGGAA